jgi:hypothetical protein
MESQLISRNQNKQNVGSQPFEAKVSFGGSKSKKDLSQDQLDSNKRSFSSDNSCSEWLGYPIFSMPEKRNSSSIRAPNELESLKGFMNSKKDEFIPPEFEKKPIFPEKRDPWHQSSNVSTNYSYNPVQNINNYSYNIYYPNIPQQNSFEKPDYPQYHDSSPDYQYSYENVKRAVLEGRVRVRFSEEQQTVYASSFPNTRGNYYPNSTGNELTLEQKRRIEANREKAMERLKVKSHQRFIEDFFNRKTYYS